MLTALLGLVVSLLLGTYLYQRIGNGLERDRIEASSYEAQTLVSAVQAQWDTSTAKTLDDLNTVTRDLINAYLAPPGPNPSRYVVLARSPASTGAVVAAGFESGPVRLADLSTELRSALTAAPERQQIQVTEIELDGASVPAVVVGSVVQLPTAGAYDLYLVYPMQREATTMRLIANALGLGALILVLLVAAIAWVVTRQVVEPVRRAAVVSQRLAAGKLDERMTASGTDDLALLGTSFNAMADSLQSQIRQLESLSAVQQRFVSDVSHELRTPLTTIRMAVDLIHDSRDDFTAPVARSAELLAGQLDRFEALLTDLLEISRFDAGAAVLHLEPVDLRTIVRSVVEASAPLAMRRGSAVSIHAPSRPAVAEVDERRVERILRNLVVNAIEHGEGRPIDIWVRSTDEAVAILVEDHGVGLGPGEASLVFTRFWRADPARARTTGGTGLGLAISLEDARLHDGWLQAWGRPGEGSRFRLTLPAREGHRLTSSPLPLAPESSR
ncbi:MAG: HAMP domain-containing histidine kinase [Tetrasphaera sp.]|nr:HAMP domain-containing histidine kinase [Tetrasphaera sp.]